MAFIHDDALDALLSYIATNGDKLHICSAEPTVFGTLNSLGNKATPAFGSVTNGASNGRRLPVSAITDGTVTGSGTATHWAIVDEGNSKILATGALASSQGVTSGNTFTLAQFYINAPDAVAA